MEPLSGRRRNPSLLYNKWAATVASIWIQSTSGTPSTFGIYSSVLKSSQGYSQSTLDTVALFKDLGANIGVLAGLLYTFVVYGRRRPFSSLLCSPAAVIIAGSVLCFLGYFLTWLVVVGVIYQPPVAVVCVFMFLAGQSMPFFNTADVVTAVNNFRDFRGTAVGIMKSFLGLSGAMLIQIYRTIFTGRQAQFLLLVSILSTINPLWLMWFVRIYDTKGKDEKHHLNIISVVILVMATYLMGVIILETVITIPLWAHIVVLIVLVLILASPLSVALMNSDPDEADLSPGYTQLLSGTADAVEEENRSSTENKNMELEGNSLNLLQAGKTLNFWLLFISTACSIGSGLATLNNISQIGEALGYSTTETSTLVSLWGIWNSLGRFGAGYLSDLMLDNNGWPRPLFMATTLAAMSVGHVVIATAFPGSLYIGSILVGLCYGSQLSLMPIITSEIFGVVNMGAIFNTINIAGPIGSYVLSVRVVGYIYDQEASGDGDECTGAHCFMLSFFIMAGVTLLGSAFTLVLWWKTKTFYEQVIRERNRSADQQ